MKLLKFLLPILLVLGLPLTGLKGNSYVFVNSFPYGAYVHSSVATATFLFEALVFIGVLGLIVGLINPKFAYFSDKVNRQNVVIYYSFILILAFASYRELIYLSKITNEIKKPALNDFYREIEIGENTNFLISKIQKYKYSLQWWVSDRQSFNRIAGFPYRDPAANLIEIHFPGLTEKSKIVVEISDRFDSSNSKVIRTVLIENSKLTTSNPKLEPEDPKILMGSFKKADGKLIFHACGASSDIEADLTQLKDKFVFGFVDDASFRKKFAVFSGAILSSGNIQKLYVYSGVGSESSYDDAYNCRRYGL